MAYVYDPETGEITEDGTDDVAPSPEYDETPIEIPEPEAPEPVEPEPGEPDPTISEEDRRFEEDWDDVVAGRLTIDDVAAKYPTQIWDRVAAGSADVRDWALNQIKSAGTAAVKSVTKPDGSIDWSKVASVGVGLATYGSASRPPAAASGYQGTIPKLTGERAAVSGTYDPNRAAGSSGQRYFSDVVYGDTDSVEARAARAREQAAGLASLNASNSARRAPLTYNLRKPIDTDNIGAARPATPVAPAGGGIASLPGSKPAADANGFIIGGSGGTFDSAGVIAANNAQIQRELSGLTTDADLNRYLANTQYTPEQLANATGYRAEDIAARIGAAWREGKQGAGAYLDSAYKPTSTQAPVGGTVIGGGTSGTPVNSGSIESQLAGLRTEADLNNFFATTNRTARELATASGYNESDIQARLDAARSAAQGVNGQNFERQLTGIAGAMSPSSVPAQNATGAMSGIAAGMQGTNSFGPISGGRYEVPQGQDLMSQLGALRSNDQLNDFFAKTNATASELAAQSGYNESDIQARLDAARSSAQSGFQGAPDVSAMAPQVESYFFAKGGAIPRGLAGLPQNTIYRAKGGPARYLRGETNGQADKIATHIDGKQPAALSHGEFVVPADVVSALGGGNSDAGAKTLYSMMDRVRQQAHGTKKQMRQVDPAKVLPS